MMDASHTAACCDVFKLQGAQRKSVMPSALNCLAQSSFLGGFRVEGFPAKVAFLGDPLSISVPSIRRAAAFSGLPATAVASYPGPPCCAHTAADTPAHNTVCAGPSTPIACRSSMAQSQATCLRVLHLLAGHAWCYVSRSKSSS